MPKGMCRARLLQGLLVLSLAASCGGPEEELELQVGERSLTAAVEQWRKLVEKYFKYQHVTWALNIIKCESGGNPNAYNSSSGASGLFQHLKQYWPARATAAGFPGASPFNAEANIAASAYLLYAAGGGPQHWSCKFSPYEDFNYVPQFYKNGQPVGCKPSCNGTKITAADCGVGDCAAYGATCVDDTLGVRCVSVFCPALGTKKVCASDKLIGDCDDGKITTGDCSVYGAFCSTAGGTAARCVSVYCAAGPSEVTKAHAVCLPDGKLAQCTAQGAVTNPMSCPAGESCVASGGSASCVKPGSPTPTPTPDAGPPPAGQDAGTPPIEPEPTPQTDAGPSWPTPPEPPSEPATVGGSELQGGCAVARTSAPPLPILLLLVLACLRRRCGR
jgi:hypothetical protein